MCTWCRPPDRMVARVRPEQHHFHWKFQCCDAPVRLLYMTTLCPRARQISCHAYKPIPIAGATNNSTSHRGSLEAQPVQDAVRRDLTRRATLLCAGLGVVSPWVRQLSLAVLRYTQSYTDLHYKPNHRLLHVKLTVKT